MNEISSGWPINYFMFFLFLLLILLLRSRERKRNLRRGVKIWEYEAKLFANPNGRNLAEIEIKKFKKGAVIGELKIYGRASSFDGRITIAINNETISELDVYGKGKRIKLANETHYSEEKPKRHKGSFYFPIFNLKEVHNGNEVSVRTPSLPLIKGHFVRD